MQHMRLNKETCLVRLVSVWLYLVQGWSGLFSGDVATQPENQHHVITCTVRENQPFVASHPHCRKNKKFSICNYNMYFWM